MENNTFKPAIAVPPGATLLEHLDMRGMTQAELAKRLGFTTKHINRIIKGKEPVTPGTSIKLENVLGIPASFWQSLEATYQETRARVHAEKEMTDEISIAKEVYNALATLSWVTKTRDMIEKVNNLRKYYGVASLNLLGNVNQIPVRFWKSNLKNHSYLLTLAWLRQGELLAEKIKTAAFNYKKLKQYIPKFRSYTLKSPAVINTALVEKCAECGIALVFVPHLPKTGANGVTHWITKDKVIIQLSVRRKFADIFWFSFFHELGHVILSHSKKEVFINDQADVEYENAANDFAANTLISLDDYLEFIDNEDFSKDAIIDFAQSIKIHPGIVYGRLCREKILKYGTYSGLQERYDIISN